MPLPVECIGVCLHRPVRCIARQSFRNRLTKYTLWGPGDRTFAGAPRPLGGVLHGHGPQYRSPRPDHAGLPLLPPLGWAGSLRNESYPPDPGRSPTPVLSGTRGSPRTAYRMVARLPRHPPTSRTVDPAANGPGRGSPEPLTLSMDRLSAALRFTDRISKTSSIPLRVFPLSRRRLAKCKRLPGADRTSPRRPTPFQVTAQPESSANCPVKLFYK